MNRFHVGEGQQPVPLAAGALADRHKIGVAAFEMITAAGLMASPGQTLPGDTLKGVHLGVDASAERNPVILLGSIEAQHHDAA